MAHTAKLYEEATVMVDGRVFTGTVYHLWGEPEGSWASLRTPEGYCAGGPVGKWIECDEDWPS